MCWSAKSRYLKINFKFTKQELPVDSCKQRFGRTKKIHQNGGEVALYQTKRGTNQNVAQHKKEFADSVPYRDHLSLCCKKKSRYFKSPRSVNCKKSGISPVPQSATVTLWILVPPHSTHFYAPPRLHQNLPVDAEQGITYTWGLILRIFACLQFWKNWKRHLQNQRKKIRLCLLNKNLFHD